jgi:hypothetical protein
MYVRYGGYCAIRRTKPPLTYGWHWQWSPDRVRWLHYEPIRRETKWWRAAIHKLWFEGRIRRYDTEWGTHGTQLERRRFRRRKYRSGGRRATDD